MENIQTSMLDSVPSLPPQPPLSAGMKMKAVSVERFLDGGRGRGSGEASNERPRVFAGLQRLHSLTGPKPKGIKVETFRTDYLIRTPKVENSPKP